jgi:hypothetical protein
MVEIQSHHRDCLVSFIFRGNEVAPLYAAHDTLPAAAAHAANLIEHLRGNGVKPRTLVYEFDANVSKWCSSFAELVDGRLVTDRNILVAFEKLPRGFSLGLVRHDDPREG